MPSYHFVLDRLAVGDCWSRTVPGWCAIVTVMSTEELHGVGHSDLMLPASVPVLHCEVDDGVPGLRSHLDAAVAFIREHVRRGAVLVHCGAGRSRSASVVIAYLVSCGMSLQEAEAHVKHRRRSACPFSGFLAEIREHFGCDALFHAGPSRF